MENVDLKVELSRRVGDVIGDIKMARGAVEAGKEIACDRILQGISAKLLNLLDFVQKLPEIGNVNVASTTTEN